MSVILKGAVVISQVLGGVLVLYSFFWNEDEGGYLPVIGFVLLSIGKLATIASGSHEALLETKKLYSDFWNDFNRD